MDEAPHPIPSDATPKARHWNSAPDVIRLWAYYFSCFVAFVVTVGVLLLVCGVIDISDELKHVAIPFYAGISLFHAWHIFSLRRGAAVAWWVQVFISAWAVWGFPLFTIIHCIIFSQWFKPETKAWFGVR